MDIRERIVVNYLDGNRLCQDWGQWQAVASEILFLKDCCVAFYVEPASNIRSILLCPLGEPVRHSSLRCCGLTVHSQALRCHTGHFCNCPHCPSNACESQLIIGRQIAG